MTAFSAAAKSINTAMVEARAGIDFVLIPEVTFSLTGPTGFLATLHQRVVERGSAVVVVAEGAGQEILAATGNTNESGNARLSDIGQHLNDEITAHFAAQGSPLTLKHIDPGYLIRSVPADPHDSVYCIRLAQAAAHTGMAGRTDMVVGRRHHRFSHVPIQHVVSKRSQVAPDGDLWLSVLESTAQPRVLA